MESTGALFEDDSPQWYVALGDRWVGPLKASEVYEKIQGSEIGWAHFIWKAAQADWRRICDVPPFKELVPRAPALGKPDKPVIKQAGKRPPPGPVAAAAKKGGRKKWFLYYNQSQFGPFASDEVERYLRIGKIHGRVHVWRDGMKGWERLETVDRFEAALKASSEVRVQKGSKKEPARPGKSGAPAAEDKRTAARRPLVAKILVAADDSVIVGVCRDISVGGMQVLTDRVPGITGSRIKLNVSPSSSDEKMRIDPFVAEGVIVRILEDGRGFSFRFDRLPDVARRGIETYISVSER